MTTSSPMATTANSSNNEGAIVTTNSLIRRVIGLVLVLSVLAVVNNTRGFQHAAASKDESDTDRPWQVMRSARAIPLETTENTTSTNNKNVEETSLTATTNSTADYSSFSACLLTKDDSHFLIEWLAYHYHTLPLRHLIVAVDPNSKTSPSFLFDKWRKHGLMTIDEWTDVDYFINSKTNQTGTRVHRYRQKKFYQHCMKRLKDANRTWTLMIDVDEYLSYNTYNRNDTTDIETPGTFLSFLNRNERHDSELQQDLQQPCIMMPRLRYGSVESTPNEVERNVPSGFNGTAFQTLRYRKHGHPKAKRVYGAGKSIIDVSRIPKKEMKTSNPHRTVPKCSKNVFLKPSAKVAFVVRHYLGSLEQFFFRSDARQANEASNQVGMKSQQTYDKHKDLDYAADDVIRPWLKGFVNNVGMEVAIELLDGVGNVSVAPAMSKR